MLTDFRSHLAYLEDKGKLLRVKREVNTRFGIAAGIRKTSDIDGPALLFENVKDYPGWKIAGGVYATQKLLALALGLPIDADEWSILKRYLDCIDRRVKPKSVTTGPVKEIILKGDDIDLTSLPVCQYSELDSGLYLTAGVEVGKHPDTGIQNVSIHRRKILDKNKTAILADNHQHLGKMIIAAEKKGQGLPIATVIGPEPSFTIASVCRAPEGVDETDIAGAFRGSPLEVITCETIDVEVPANAEVIIEGKTIPNKRVIDGPFGEYPGNYITLTGEPFIEVFVVEVTAITMRRQPIFQAMLAGVPMTENHILKKWAYTAKAYQVINKFADIKAINLTRGGCAQYNLVIAIDKKDDLQPKNIINALLRANAGVTCAIIVDSDIDVYDSTEVEWAIATRMRVDEGIVIVPGLQKSKVFRKLSGSRMGMDATAPLKDKEWYQKIKIPGIEDVDYI